MLKKYNNHIFCSNYIPTNIKKLNRKKKYLYFCGIGNPEEFEYTLKKYNFKIAKKFEVIHCLIFKISFGIFGTWFPLFWTDKFP